MFKNAIHLLCVAVVFAGSFASLEAQTPPPAQTAAPAAEGQKTPEGGMPTFIRPESPEQRKARLGTAEDPGIDPDPEKVWWRFGRAYNIHRYDREFVAYTGGQDPSWIRPFGFANLYRELFQHNEKYVWVWEPVREANPEQPAEDIKKSTESERRFSDQDIAYLEQMRSEFYELTPREGTAVIRFEESSEGLPLTGSWRNSLAVADMNGDGNVDLIAPPERSGGTVPSIFLGDGQGHWKFWETVQWPHGLDYGGVAAADFNKDGKMDLVFAVHLSGVYVFLGDGKGNFTESQTGLQDFPTRRVAVTDVNRDGLTDIIAISEGPTVMQQVQKQNDARIAVLLNRKNAQSWEPVSVADRSKAVGGDWLAIGNFNSDKYPDVAGASIFFNSTQTVYLSDAKKGWTILTSESPTVIPALSYYFANAAGKFTSSKTDDLIASFVRIWPPDLNPKLIPQPPFRTVAGIDRISFAGGTPKRMPIMRWNSSVAISGVATGDFSGDGKLDIILTRNDPREFVLLLGDGRGGFVRTRIEGLTFLPQYAYDIKVADVNKDGRPDVIMMYEADAATTFSPRNGSIRVYLNRGVAAAGMTAAAGTNR